MKFSLPKIIQLFFGLSLIVISLGSYAGSAQAACTYGGTFACSSFAGSYGIPANYTVGTGSYNICNGVPTYTGGCSAPCVDQPGTIACSSVAGSYGIPANYTVGTASYTTNSCTGISTYTGGCSAPCVDQPGTIACSSVAGQYGIPANYTVGTASYTTNSCTGVSTYISGCSAPVVAPTTASISASPASVPAAGSVTISWGGNNTPTTYDVSVGSQIFTGLTVDHWTGTLESIGISAPGAYTLGVTACNAGGCKSSTGSVTVTIAPPTSAHISITPNPVTTTQSFSTSWGGSGNPDNYTITVSGGSLSSPAVYPMGGLVSIDSEPNTFGPGVYSVTVEACNLGGCVTSPPVVFTVTAGCHYTCASGGAWVEVSNSCSAFASCPATTINHCSLSATPSGGSSGSCSSGYSGACNYSCTNGVWSQNSNSCAPASASDCSATTINHCSLSATPTGGSSGSCSLGYAGACNFSCNNGVWSPNSNSCTSSSCTTPWGATIANGVTVTAFRDSSVLSPAVCVSQTGTCTNGAFVPPLTYTHASCDVLQASIDSFTAKPARVQKGNHATLSWSTTNVTSCSVTGTNGFSQGGTSGTDVDTGAINAQTTFTLSCDSGAVTARAVVNVVPGFIEF